jgi:MFS family permease
VRRLLDAARLLREIAAERRILALILFETLASFCLWMPIWTLFLLSKGFSLLEVALLDGCYRFFNLAFEIPTGMISDHIGHRRMLAVGALFYAAAMLGIVYAVSFAAHVGVWIVWALAAACFSGADSSFLYDAATQPGGGIDRFRKAWAATDALALASTASASLLSGVLFLRSKPAPFLVDAAIGVLAALVILTLGRGGREGPVAPRPAAPPLRARIRSAADELRSGEVAKLIALSGVSALVMWGNHLFYQPYFGQMGLKVTAISSVYAACQVVGAVGALAGGAARSRLASARAVARTYLPWLWIFHLPLIFLPPVVAVPGLLAAWFWYYFFDPHLGALLNRTVGSANRATLLSVQALVNGVLMLLGSVVAGALADRFGARRAALCIAALAAAVYGAVCAVASMRRVPAPVERKVAE